MKEVDFRTKGVCSSNIHFTIDDEGRIHDLSFKGGCNGNLKAVGLLCEGRDARSVAAMLKGNTCGSRKTSCADQLAAAIEANC